MDRRESTREELQNSSAASMYSLIIFYLGVTDRSTTPPAEEFGRVNRAADLRRPFVVIFVTGKQIAFLRNMDAVGAMDVDSNLTFLLRS